MNTENRYQEALGLITRHHEREVENIRGRIRELVKLIAGDAQDLAAKVERSGPDCIEASVLAARANELMATRLRLSDSRDQLRELKNAIEFAEKE